MTIYTYAICAGLLWLMAWCLLPGPRRNNCPGCAWLDCRGIDDCSYLSARGVGRGTQREIIAGRLICPGRMAERRRRWWDRG